MGRAERGWAIPGEVSSRGSETGRESERDNESMCTVETEGGEGGEERQSGTRRKTVTEVETERDE